MSFTVEYLEYMLVMLVRISMIVAVVPVFGNMNVPRNVKFAISVFLTIITLNMYGVHTLEYQGVLGFGLLVAKEAITGLLIGMGTQFCMYILTFAGNMLDMEIGFAMAMEMDPVSQVQTTISSTLLSAIYTLTFLVTDMHYYVIKTLIRSYELIPIGGAHITGSIYKIYGQYMLDYFLIGFRLILPIFACTLLTNVVLGILAKVAPQMNMFVIGMQMKIFVGLFLFYVMMGSLTGLSEFLFSEMRDLTDQFITFMSGG
ncbi:MAG: flagellar biosynthetic protein FliR [Lachnospiraceae bacterium]|jgi:flagellar biosynthetic protein FliR|nr:flagellar biosynthetic protein FliR [Lachnospiraceae bacterium]MEE3460440.1 flagellar biosynthetic protein FliR [Lachnospiraceae bacterium]